MGRRLTELALRALKPTPAQYDVFDDVVRNFGVRVSPRGTLTFFVMYRRHGGRKRETLGRFPDVPLAKARELAQRRLVEMRDGLTLSPAVAPAQLAFDQAVSVFLEKHCAVRNKPRTARDMERLLSRHWISVFGRRNLGEITTDDVSAVLDRLVKTRARRHTR